MDCVDAQAAMATLVGTVQRQAPVLTYGDCLMAMAGVFVLGLLCVPLVRRPVRVGAASL